MSEPPVWACSRWGDYEHDWLDCYECQNRYEEYLAEGEPQFMRILVFGDVGLDCTRVGKPERLSPEAPATPVLKQIDTHAVPAMAANVAANLAVQYDIEDVDVRMFGAIADDEAGQQLNDLLDAFNIDARGLYYRDNYATTVKHRIADPHGRLLARMDVEDPRPMSKEEFVRCLGSDQRTPSWDLELGYGYSLVVLSDYAKGYLTSQMCKCIIRRADKHNCLVLVDPKGVDWEKYSGKHVYLSPNLDELTAFVAHYRGLDVRELRERVEQDWRKYVPQLAEDAICDADVSGVIVTLGERGAYFVADAKTRHYRTDEQLEVFDSVGAGDVFLAKLAAGVVARTPELREYKAGEGYEARIADALGDAVLAGTLACKQPGTSIVDSVAIEEEKLRRGLITTSTKIIEANALVLEELQNRFERDTYRPTVFTCGCFDLFHAGHLHTLQWAKSHLPGARLVVGIAGDEAVALLKGYDRPLIPLKHRAKLIEALACVDLVITYKQRKATAIIEALQPAVFVKGGEYAEVGVDEDEEAAVDAYGGVIRFAPVFDHPSTTDLLVRIRAT